MAIPEGWSIQPLRQLYITIVEPIDLFQLPSKAAFVSPAFLGKNIKYAGQDDAGKAVGSAIFTHWRDCSDCAPVDTGVCKEHAFKETPLPLAPATQQLSVASLVNEKIHLLLPASNGNVDFCKTLLTARILGYPTPTLIAWNQTFDQNRLLGGGSHVAKIEKVLTYLESMDSSADKELVLMMDAYDIWFQLRPEVLLHRYHAINAAANERLSARLGKAFQAERLEQTIIFAAGKRCAPNQMHTIACYPIPESPLPEDLYGANTDTVMGRNKYTSLRQRWLNSGYIIGPVADMRLLFRRAHEKVQANEDHDEWDNGSHGSDFMYHGSDQSIFNIILGEQEYQREVMRRRHLTWHERARGQHRSAPTFIEGTKIDDPLNPSFLHEPGVAKDGKVDEFGVGLDYFSQLGQQTVNCDEDSRFLRYNANISEQLHDRHGLFDCPSRVTGALAPDILESRPPLDALPDSEALDWRGSPLFTNLCLNEVPVMIHHNGDKGARAWQWPRTWMQPVARRLLENSWKEDSISPTGASADAGAAFLPDGQHLSWDALCPAEYEKLLFLED